MNTNNNKKYELTEETITFDTGDPILCYDEELDTDVFEYEQTTVHRIKAVRDFGSVHAGDLGGFIEKEENLSHDGNCWVSDDALIYENARVYGNAIVCDMAKVAGHVQVYGNSQIFENACVASDDDIVFDAKLGAGTVIQ